jgi:DNA adenine methylase
LNSFIRWAGSKRLILGKLRASAPATFQRYIEPFAGSASLFFDLCPNEAILGDLNEELILTFKQVKAAPDEVIALLRNIGPGKANYLKIRSLNPVHLTAKRRAARFIYLNHFCFNGLYRVNLAGHFNVPYFPNNTALEFREKLVSKASQLLKNTQFVSGDFDVTLSKAQKGDFAYIDPPYVLKKREVFSDYTQNSFSTKDLVRLSQTLDALDKKGVHFMLSYADCREARQLLKKWNSERVWTRRNIAGFTGNRKGTFELLGSNFARPAHAKN